MTDKLLQPEQELESSNHLLDDILARIKDTAAKAMSLPANISAVGSSPKDLSILINAAKKKEILSVLKSIVLGDKISLLSEIDDRITDNGFDKKEMPYISRFTVYSILEEVFDRSGEVLENQKEINKTSYFEIVDGFVHTMGLESKDIILLRELISKNEDHYLKHFGEEYKAKLKLVKKVLRSYKK